MIQKHIEWNPGVDMGLMNVKFTTTESKKAHQASFWTCLDVLHDSFPHKIIVVVELISKQMLLYSRAPSSITVGKFCKETQGEKEIQNWLGHTCWQICNLQLMGKWNPFQLLQLSPAVETNYVWHMFMLENPELWHHLRVRHFNQVRTRHLF